MTDDFEDRLDRYWDDVVRGSARTSRDLDPEIADTIRWFHALGGGVAAVPARAIGIASNGTAAIALVRPAKAPSPRRRRLSRLGWLPRLDVAAAVVLLLVLGSLALAFNVATRPLTGQETGSEPTVQLYVVDETGRRPVPVDPLTLTDLDVPPGEQPSPAVASAPPFSLWLVSADGSTAIRIEGPYDSQDFPVLQEIEIVVYDGLNGPERVRFRTPLTGGTFPMLSVDGSRLVTSGGPWNSTTPGDWIVYDTSTGNVITKVHSLWWSPLSALWSRVWIDPPGQRLYLLTVVDLALAEGPWPVQLVAYDLTSGAEAGRLDLPDLRAGNWQTGSAHDGSLVAHRVDPAAAVSPDGRQLALLHADGTAVTLVDTGRLAVERTVSVTLAAGPTAVVATPVADDGVPEVATDWFATYSADGSELYVSGFATEVGADRREVRRALGLHRIDLTSGTVVARALDDASAWICTIPGGESVYAVAIEGDQLADAAPTVLLRRLDADSLATLAERELPLFFPSVLLWPRTPGSCGP